MVPFIDYTFFGTWDWGLCIVDLEVDGESLSHYRIELRKYLEFCVGFQPYKSFDTK